MSQYYNTRYICNRLLLYSARSSMMSLLQKIKLVCQLALLFFPYEEKEDISCRLIIIFLLFFFFQIKGRTSVHFSIGVYCRYVIFQNFFFVYVNSFVLFTNLFFNIARFHFLKYTSVFVCSLIMRRKHRPQCTLSKKKMTDRCMQRKTIYVIKN